MTYEGGRAQWMGGPGSRAEFESNPSQWPEMIGYLDAGASFRVDRVHDLVTIETHDLVLIGRAQDGVHTYDNVRWLHMVLPEAPPLERVR